MNSTAGNPKRARGHYLLIGGLAALIVLWRLGTPVMDEHECYVALTAKAMADRSAPAWIIPSDLPYELPSHTALNHLMVPVENGRLRLNKTPLPYWSAALSMWIGGGAGNLTTRIPSALSAILLACVTLALGRRMFGPRAGLMGALMLVASVGFQRWGRDARPEMMLCMFVTSAMACFYMALESPSRRGHLKWMAAFWILMGLGNLAKEVVPLILAWPAAAYVFWRRGDETQGPAPARRMLAIFLVASLAGLGIHIAVTSVGALQWWKPVGVSDSRGAYLTMALTLGLPMLWLLVRCQAWPAVRRLLPTAVPGVVVMLAMVVPWYLYMYHLFGDLLWRVLTNQVTDRAAGAGDYQVMSADKYLAALVTLSLPWVAFIPGAFAVGLMKRFESHRRPLAFLLLWAAGLLIVFAAAAGKRDHYILPMIPALCLLMGFAAEDVFFNHAWIKPALSRVLTAGYAVVAVMGALSLAAMLWAQSMQLHAHSAPRWVQKVLAWTDLPPEACWVLAVAGAVAAYCWVAAYVVGRRRSLALALPLLATGFVVLVVMFYTFVNRYDDRAAIRDFAIEAAAKVPPAAPVYHWGEAQAKTVFYFGRYIPAAQWTFYRQVPPDKTWQVNKLLVQWLSDNPAAMPWMFGYETDQGDLAPLGYRPVLSKTDMQKKKGQPPLIFVLYERMAPDPTKPAREKGTPAEKGGGK